MEETKELTEVTAALPAQDESKPDTETTDYVKELYLQGQQRAKDDRRKVRLMRLCTLLMAVIAATLATALVLARPVVRALANDFHTITVKVDSIDVEGLMNSVTDTLVTVNGVLEDGSEALKSVDVVADNLAAFDVSGLNKAIKGLDSAVGDISETVQSLSSIDIAGLNSSIQQLQRSSEMLANLKIFKTFG